MPINRAAERGADCIIRDHSGLNTPPDSASLLPSTFPFLLLFMLHYLFLQLLFPLFPAPFLPVLTFLRLFLSFTSRTTQLTCHASPAQATRWFSCLQVHERPRYLINKSGFVWAAPLRVFVGGSEGVICKYTSIRGAVQAKRTSYCVVFSMNFK